MNNEQDPTPQMTTGVVASSALPSENRFGTELRALVDALPRPAWLAGADGRPFHFNRRWLSYVQLTPEQCINFGWHALLYPGDAFAWTFCWAAAVREGKAFELDFRLKRASSHRYRWFNTLCSPIRMQAGGVLAWVGLFSDINELKPARLEFDTALEAFEAFVREVHDHALFTTDNEGRIIHWNAGTERLTGYPGDEAVGKNYAMLHLAEDLAGGLPERQLDEALRGGRADCERRVVRKDGSVFYARLATTLLRRESVNEPEVFAHVVGDLTHLKGAEASLQLHMALWEALPVGVLLLSVDREGRRLRFTILAANPSSLEVSRRGDLQVEKVLNEELFVAFPNLPQREFSSLLGKVMRSARSQGFGEIRVSHGGVPERVFATKGFPLPNGCVGLMFENVTARARTEEGLRTSEERFRSVVEWAPDALVVTNRLGRVTLANRRAELMFGYPRTDLIGQPVEMLLAERDQARFRNERRLAISGAQKRGLNSTFHFDGLREDAVEFPIAVRMSSVETHEGVRTCYAIRPHG